MRIVDAHHHLWDLAALPYPWLAKPNPDAFIGDTTPLCRDYTIADFLADAQCLELVASVHLQAEVAPARSVDESMWLQRIADAHGRPDGIVAFADLTDPQLEAVLDRHARARNFRGIRQILNRHDDPRFRFVEHDHLADPRWHAGAALLARRGLSFDLQIYPQQMPEASRAARRHPDLAFVLNHTGMPIDRTPEGIALWREGIRALADCPNVAVKISGLGMTDHRWTTDSIRPFVRETIEIVGTRRCLFASNFPVDRLYSDYRTLWSAYDTITADLSADERADLFERNARRVYRI
jgi:predicted TIM-barrel fold metal-dependent hydrolase